VKIYPNAEFDGDFPIDQVDEDDRVVIFPGGSAAEAIVEILQRVGMKTNKPEHLGEHGWGFHAGLNRLEIWIMLNMAEDYHYYMYVQRSSMLNWLLGRSNRAHGRLLKLLDRELKSDRRFSNIAWFAAGDSHNETAFPVPVDDE
jgi:hypothetical protein